jgi:hypothetical protein
MSRFKISIISILVSLLIVFSCSKEKTPLPIAKTSLSTIIKNDNSNISPKVEEIMKKYMALSKDTTISATQKNQLKHDLMQMVIAEMPKCKKEKNNHKTIPEITKNDISSKEDSNNTLLNNDNKVISNTTKNSSEEAFDTNQALSKKNTVESAKNTVSQEVETQSNNTSTNIKATNTTIEAQNTVIQPKTKNVITKTKTAVTNPNTVIKSQNETTISKVVKPVMIKLTGTFANQFGYLSLSRQAFAQKTVGAMNYSTNLTYMVSSFKVNIIGKQSQNISGNRLNQSAINVIMQQEKGQRIKLSNIKVISKNNGESYLISDINIKLKD